MALARFWCVAFVCFWCAFGKSAPILQKRRFTKVL
jgi:hypothetical protein